MAFVNGKSKLKLLDKLLLSSLDSTFSFFLEPAAIPVVDVLFVFIVEIFPQFFVNIFDPSSCEATLLGPNTLILFLADNGASSERGYPPGFDRPGQNRDGEEIIYPYQKYDRPGNELTWGYLGKAWAGALNAPFRYWKRESFEGGSCSPFIMHWPEGLKGKDCLLYTSPSPRDS